MTLVEHSIGAHLEQIARQAPDAPAVVYDGKTLTYAALNRTVNTIAGGLLSLGVGRGTHVCLMMQNRPTTLCCLYALLRIGAVAVLLNTKTPPQELMQRLADTDTDILLDDDPVRCSDLCGQLRLSVYIGEGTEILQCSTLQDAICAGTDFPETLLQAAANAVTPDDPDVILFTSGTTSHPKAVVTTHRSRLNNALSTAELNAVTADDRFCVALPMNHCFCLTAGVLAPMSMGACVCLSPDHHSRNVLGTIEKEHCTVLHGVPTLFLSMLHRLETERFDVSSLRMGMIGGAGYAPEQFLQIAKTLDFDLIPSLGQTEATAGITAAAFDDSDLVKSTTVGRLFPGLSARFCDPQTRTVLPDGEIGELCIRGYSVMQGYYRPTAIPAIDADGYLHTGDLGHMDENGNIILVGRCKDIIIRGGENIAPAEIETLLLREPGVRAVKVLGVPDTHFGEEICACIATETPALVPDPDAIRERIANELPVFKIPKYFVFFSAFPTTDTGKPDRKTLLKNAISLIEKGDYR